MLDCRQQQAVLSSRVPQASIGSMGSLGEVRAALMLCVCTAPWQRVRSLHGLDS